MARKSTIFIFGNTLCKSRTATGGPNSRRPDLSYGVDYYKKFELKKYGPFELNLSHRYIGNHIDWTGSKNEFVKSINLVDMSIRRFFWKCFIL